MSTHDVDNKYLRHISHNLNLGRISLKLTDAFNN